MLPSHAELEYFLEVSGTLNFSRASERLGISQPSLSMAIRRLEKTVGAQLFIRHKQGVTLTQSGKQLLLQVRQLLQCWEDTKSKALASENEVQGTFTIGCHSTIAIHTVSQFMPDLLETYPKLNFNLRHDLSRRITEGVINLSIDFGIVANPIKHPDLIIRKLCDDQVTFWVGEGVRKIQNPYDSQAIILCDPDLTQTQFLLKKCKKSQIATGRIMAIPSLSVIASLCVVGTGIGILPTRVVKALYPNELRAVKNAPVYLDEICLVYRNELRNVQAAQTILDSIKRCFG